LSILKAWPNERWLLDSLFTGTGTDGVATEFVLRMLWPAINFGINFHLDTKTASHKFCSILDRFHFGIETCHFKDVDTLNSDEAPCVTHHPADCPIRRGYGGGAAMCGGFSCKSLSNQSSKKVKTAVKEKATSTGKTWAGFCKHLKLSKIPLGWVENLPEIMSPDNRTIMEKDLQECGNYKFRMWKMKAISAGWPVGRTRAFGVLIEQDLFGMSDTEVASLFSKISDLLDKFKVAWPSPISELQYPADHPAVRHAFVDLRNTRSKDGADDDLKSAARNERFLSKLNVPWSATAPPEDVRNSKWFNFLSPRQGQVLAYELYRHQGKSLPIEIDCSQEMSRGGRTAGMIDDSSDEDNESSPEIVKAVLPKDVSWLTSQRRLRIGREALRYQG
jgi:site-specific DNA-cytosine methylase